MKAEKVGRTVGIALRIAGRVFGASLVGAGAAAGSIRGVQAEAQRARLDATGKFTRAAGRGIGGFVRPFVRIGHILWLEVVGALFLLIALSVATNLWRLRSGYAAGPEHRKFLLVAGLFTLFLYLGLSSFWRARKK